MRPIHPQLLSPGSQALETTLERGDRGSQTRDLTWKHHPTEPKCTPVCLQKCHGESTGWWSLGRNIDLTIPGISSQAIKWMLCTRELKDELIFQKYMIPAKSTSIGNRGHSESLTVVPVRQESRLFPQPSGEACRPKGICFCSQKITSYPNFSTNTLLCAAPTSLYITVCVADVKEVLTSLVIWCSLTLKHCLGDMLSLSLPPPRVKPEAAQPLLHQN